ncbi:hypothetical protein M885DRAFT_533526 [Pelagophyceae sp. CCMP2097]|nr:hypothetical protein M885DRAFT_533526 [Pelagophyceae sp. CCMP2097]
MMVLSERPPSRRGGLRVARRRVAGRAARLISSRRPTWQSPARRRRTGPSACTCPRACTAHRARRTSASSCAARRSARRVPRRRRPTHPRRPARRARPRRRRRRAPRRPRLWRGPRRAPRRARRTCACTPPSPPRPPRARGAAAPTSRAARRGPPCACRLGAARARGGRGGTWPRGGWCTRCSCRGPRRSIRSSHGSGPGCTGSARGRPSAPDSPRPQCRP